MRELVAFCLMLADIAIQKVFCLNIRKGRPISHSKIEKTIKLVRPYPSAENRQQINREREWDDFAVIETIHGFKFFLFVTRLMKVKVQDYVTKL